MIIRASLLLLALLPAVALAQGDAAITRDPNIILQAAKAASGGKAWDALVTQHSKLKLTIGGLNGTAERWADIATGRSYLSYDLGVTKGAQGFDGSGAWSQDASGQSRPEDDDAARQLALNAAYRDRLAMWYPDRAKAKIEFKERTEADGATFDVVRITPEGGRPFEYWINTDTMLIERLTEREQDRTRTEIFMDFRDVQGVKIPFRVRANRGDPRYDDVIVVDSMTFNEPLAGVSFAQPAPPKPDFAFPAGKTSVDVPLELFNGHLFIEAKINGKGPMRMLFDSGGANVLMPSAARKLGIAAAGAAEARGVGEQSIDMSFTNVDSLEVGGIVVGHQNFAVVGLDDFMRRVEGLDDVAGLVGYELFKRFPVRIDYAHLRATFYDPSAFKHAGAGTRVPFRFKGHVPLVHGSVDGIAGEFEIDTGSRGSLTLATPFVQANGLVDKYHATRSFISGSGLGGPVRALLARAQTLSLGEVTIERPLVALATQAAGNFADASLAGNVGYALLRQYDVTFDYGSQSLWFEPNANQREPELQDRAGMWVERDAKGFKIVDVIQGSPAASAGLKAGDLIVAVDGKPWKTTSLPALRAKQTAPAGTKLALKLSGGAERIVKLADLI